MAQYKQAIVLSKYDWMALEAIFHILITFNFALTCRLLDYSVQRTLENSPLNRNEVAFVIFNATSNQTSQIFYSDSIYLENTVTL